MPEHALAIQQLVTSFKLSVPRPLKAFQRMLGLMASASSAIQLGLLHMRPLQYWLKPRVPPHACYHGRLRIKVSQVCVAALAPWKDHQWMEQGVPLGMVCRRKVVSTEASNLGWGGAVRRQTGLSTFLPDLRGHHVLVSSDSMTVVSFINRWEQRAHSFSTSSPQKTTLTA